MIYYDVTCILGSRARIITPAPRFVSTYKEVVDRPLPRQSVRLTPYLCWSSYQWSTGGNTQILPAWLIAVITTDCASSQSSISVSSSCLDKLCSLRQAIGSVSYSIFPHSTPMVNEQLLQQYPSGALKQLHPTGCAVAVTLRPYGIAAQISNTAVVTVFYLGAPFGTPAPCSTLAVHHIYRGGKLAPQGRNLHTRKCIHPTWVSSCIDIGLLRAACSAAGIEGRASRSWKGPATIPTTGVILTGSRVHSATVAFHCSTSTLVATPTRCIGRLPKLL